MADNRTQLPEEVTPRTRTSMVEFIKSWQKHNSIQEVADDLGLKPASVAARASKYRNGTLAEDGKTFVIEPIAIKQMPRKGGGAKLDAAAANALLTELGDEQVAEQIAKLKAAKLARAAKAAENAAE